MYISNIRIFRGIGSDLLGLAELNPKVNIVNILLSNHTFFWAKL